MGDAVHRHTPMGGLGLNTSVQDGYNLAWKLAAVIRGHARPDLLKTYDAERSPVARQIVERAYSSLETLPPMFNALGLPASPSEGDMQTALAKLKSPDAEAATIRAALRKAIDGTTVAFGGGHGVEMNQRYDSSAVVSDGTADPGYSRDPALFYEASTRPGAHLPHAWLTAGKKRVSTLDLCGKGQFTLLTGLAGRAAWTAAADQVASSLGVEIRVRVIGPSEEFEDSWGEYRNVSQIDESGALLVRPDMFIGWRSHDNADASGDKLISVMKSLLSA